MPGKKTHEFWIGVPAAMSSITINLFPCDEGGQRTVTAGKQQKKKRKNKRFRVKEQKGLLTGKGKQNQNQGQFRGSQTPHHNGPLSPPSAPRTFSRPPSVGSHPVKPSALSSGLSCPVPPSSKGGDKKPKELVNSLKPAASPSSGPSPGPSGLSSLKPTTTPAANPTKYLAIDCEMVGTGPKGRISQLARCSIVSYDGDVIYDKFISPPVPVTDYRTKWSGIRRGDLERATPYAEARKEILRLLSGKVVIGHAIHNDFKVLSYSHPAALTRDTSRIPLLNLKAGFAERECASLKRLTKAIFNRDIQTGKRGHSSVEDARASMELYKVVEVEWERKLLSAQRAS
ncbi:hypothetical protein INR49_020417 [Caranx melampygus]|nr:hypothetical protein INR49_020417 [Caranx melampygus]